MVTTAGHNGIHVMTHFSLLVRNWTIACGISRSYEKRTSSAFSRCFKPSLFFQQGEIHL